MITTVNLKRGKASQHVPREQIMPGMTRSTDRQTVIRPGGTHVTHVRMQPRRETRRLAERRRDILTRP
jgi:hypothetical protein